MADTCPVLLDRTIPGLLDGKPKSLCQYSGRVLLVVNTASRCGFTRQYEGLEKLQDRFGARGLTVLGFPSNDFGNQEPGSDKDIAQFCSMTYGVKFPMFSKTSVTGSRQAPVLCGSVAHQRRRAGAGISTSTWSLATAARSRHFPAMSRLNRPN
jgi:glutathione peroxidase